MAETGRLGLRLAPEVIGWHSQLTAGFTNQRQWGRLAAAARECRFRPRAHEAVVARLCLQRRHSRSHWRDLPAMKSSADSVLRGSCRSIALSREWGVAAGTLPRMGTEGDLACPQCGERVLDTGEHTVGQQQRATCPQCHAELVRHADVEDKAWVAEQPTPLLDEEPGGGD